MAQRPAPKKRPAPPTYGGDQGYEDRRVPFMKPGEAIKKIWQGSKKPPKTPRKRSTTEGDEG